MSDIKYYMSLSVTVGVMLVGLLYSFCLAFQWINGWPDKPGYKKYIEALKPRRIYGLTLATLDLLKYLQYVRLYFQLRSWFEDERNLKYYEKGITFGRRGNKLDLYHPPNVGKAEDMKSPVVVFIYGGAWSTGERSTYCLLGRQMAEELKATVICPDYCTYPKGNVLGMVQDIADCLIWAHQNGEKFNFDKGGAFHRAKQAAGHLFVNKGSYWSVWHASTIPWTIMSMSRNEESNISPTCTEHIPYFSPTHLLKKLSQDKVNGLPPFALLHGTNDIVVPVESTTRFSKLLASRSVEVSPYLLPRVSHTEIPTDLMVSNRRLYHPIYRYINQEFRKLLGTC